MITLPDPTASVHRLEAFRNRSESPPSDAAITPITVLDSTKTTAHYLARRLHIVFNDLSLPQHIPSDWLQPGPEGLSFRSLSVREADKFVLAIEDLAHGFRPQRPTVSPNQLTFDLGDV